MMKREAIARLLGGTVDACLLASIVCAPLVMGGRHPAGILALAMIACLALCSAVTAKLLRRQRVALPATSIMIFLAAALGLLCFQLIDVRWLLSPLGTNSSLLPAWTGNSGGLFTWKTLSVAPDETRSSLILLFSYGFLLWVAWDHFKTRSDIERFLLWVGYAAAAMALLGLVQCFLPSDRFLWIYKHPFRVPGTAAQGPFINPNHFAHFIALGIGPLVWKLFSASRDSSFGLARQNAAIMSRNYWRDNALTVTCLGVILVAGVFSQSRGGLLVHGLALVVSVITASLTVGAIRLASGGVAAAALLAGGLVYLGGQQEVLQELDVATSSGASGVVATSNRMLPWRTVLRAIPDFAVLGSGGGTHAEVYRTYLPQNAPKEFTHAENGYLQIALEGGFVGLAILFGLICAIGWYCWKLVFELRSPLAIALVPGLCVSAIHSVVDFVWYIPACMTLVILQIALLLRSVEFHSSENSRDSASPVQPRSYDLPQIQLSPGLMLLLTLALGSVILRNQAFVSIANHHWENYLRDSRLADLVSEETSDKERIDGLERAIHELEACIHWNPSHSRAHLRLGEALLHQFELRQLKSSNRLGLQSIAEAARLSQYDKEDELNEWLTRAIGENRHLLSRAFEASYKGIHRNMYAGEGYIYLAQLAFLRPSLHFDQQQLVEQALLLRPANGSVMLAAASFYENWGQPDRAFELLKRAFHADLEAQDKIVELLGPSVDPETILAGIVPKHDGLYKLITQQIELENQEWAFAYRQRYFETLEEELESWDPKTQARYLTRASQVSFHLDGNAASARFLRQAVECTPNDFSLRKRLALLLVQIEQPTEAAKHLRWCLARAPSDQFLREKLRATSLLR